MNERAKNRTNRPLGSLLLAEAPADPFVNSIYGISAGCLKSDPALT
jgi:hypothetical protein